MDALGPILGSQLIAPAMMLDWPNTQDFIVTKIEKRPREMTHDHWGWGHSPELEEMPERLIIRGRLKKDGTGGIWSMCIDLEQTVIAHANWSNLCGHEHMGSAAIGVAIFGLPALIVTSPLLLAAHGAYAIGRAATGMDRHTWGVWRRLKDFLASEDVDVVHQAFLNHGNGVEAAYFDRLRAQYDEKVRAQRIAMLFENRKDDICEGPLMLRLESGTADPDEIMDEIHDWRHRHGADLKVTIHEWLGMTEEEWESWKSSKKTVLQLLEDRAAARQLSQATSDSTKSS